MSKARPATKSLQKTIATHGRVGGVAALDRLTALSAFVDTVGALARLAELGLYGEWLTKVAIILHVSVVDRDAIEGRATVEQLIEQQRSGAYA